MVYSEDMDKEKKHAKKVKAEYDEKIKVLNEKINNLQTNLENTKTDLSYLHKLKKTWSTDQVTMQSEMESLKRKIYQRELDLQDKEYEMKKLKDQGKQKEQDHGKTIHEAYSIHLLVYCICV